MKIQSNKIIMCAAHVKLNDSLTRHCKLSILVHCYNFSCNDFEYSNLK